LVQAFDSYNLSLSDVNQTIKSPGGGTLESVGGVVQQAIAYSIREDAKANTFSATELDVANSIGALQPSPQSHHAQVFVSNTMAVRRLTPKECERLQGFPDGYTDIRPKGKDTPDGSRYKALGNSWAVPVVAWIGKRINHAIT
jgi:DNA (cytosine-5)-methyltransferase 1